MIYLSVIIVSLLLLTIAKQLHDIHGSVKSARSTNQSINENLNELSSRIKHIQHDTYDQMNLIRQQIESNREAAERSETEALNVQAEAQQCLERSAESIESLRALSYDTFTLGFEQLLTAIRNRR